MLSERPRRRGDLGTLGRFDRLGTRIGRGLIGLMCEDFSSGALRLRIRIPVRVYVTTCAKILEPSGTMSTDKS